MEGYDPRTLSKEEAKEIWRKIKASLAWCHVRCSICRAQMYVSRGVMLKRTEQVGNKKVTTHVPAHVVRCTCGRYMTIDKEHFDSTISI